MYHPRRTQIQQSGGLEEEAEADEESHDDVEVQRNQRRLAQLSGEKPLEETLSVQ